jgi:carboxymethylenebutenolidase
MRDHPPERSPVTQRSDVDVATPDGVCPSVVVTPDGEGPWPAVILFMDAYGVRPALVEMAEHLGDMGYVAFLPEMYYRHGRYEPFSAATAFTDPDERARLMALAVSVTPEAVGSDTGAFLELLSGRADVVGEKVGATGYCLGARLALVAAAQYPERIAAAASVHGGHLAADRPDSPHRMVDRIKGKVYIAAAQDDDSFPPEQAALLEKALTKAGVDHVLETYPAHHGFAVPDNETYDAEAAARHWRALGDLFGATLTG